MTQHTGDTIKIKRIEQNCPNGDHACNLRGFCVNKNCANFQHRGNTIAQLTEAVERAEQRGKISTQFLSYMPSAEAWQATGPNYEPGLPVGVGATEEAAIADLKEKEAEYEELQRMAEERNTRLLQEPYPGRAFPQVEDEGDLQSMLDGLAAEHERGN